MIKPKPVWLFLSVWIVSLGAAFYAGSLIQNQSIEKAAPVAQPVNADEGSVSLAQELDASDGLTRAQKDRNALEAYLAGETVALEEALRDVAGMSEATSRLALAEAFSLPLSDPNRSQIIEGLLSQLAKTDPLAALAIASDIPSLRDSEDARVAILQVWGRQDAAAAIAWATRALAGEPARTRSNQMSAIFEGYAASDPQGAFARAMALDDNPRLRSRLLGDVIEAQIRAGSLEVAKASVEAMPESELKASLLDDLVDEWAEFDPEAAASYLDSLGEGATSRLKTSLVSEWAESDPAAAAAWLDKLSPDDPAVARASAAVIREWTRYDLAASAEWLNSLPDSPDLDRAVASYAYRAAEEDPEAAMTWAGSIKNDRRRSWMMERVAGTWKEQDAETFQSYLNNSELTTEQRERLENAQTGSGGGRRWR